MFKKYSSLRGLLGLFFLLGTVVTCSKRLVDSSPSVNSSRSSVAPSKKQTLPQGKKTVMYQIGEATDLHGRTTLTILEDGSAEAKNEQVGKNIRQFTGHIPLEEVQGLLSQIEESKVWETPKRKIAIPDEATVEITLLEEKTALHQKVLWKNQFQDTQGLRVLDLFFTSILERISNEQLH